MVGHEADDRDGQHFPDLVGLGELAQTFSRLRLNVARRHMGFVVG